MVRGKPSNQLARQVDFTPLSLRDRMNKMDRMDDMEIVALHYDYCRIVVSQTRLRAGCILVL